MKIGVFLGGWKTSVWPVNRPLRSAEQERTVADLAQSYSGVGGHQLSAS